jgi:hypothetical protein
MPGGRLGVDREHHGRDVALAVVLGKRVDGGSALGAELEVLLRRGAQLLVGELVPMTVDLDVGVDVDRVDGREIDAVFVLFDESSSSSVPREARRGVRRPS